MRPAGVLPSPVHCCLAGLCGACQEPASSQPEVQALFFPQEPAVPAPRAGGSWFQLSMLMMFPARGSVLWPGRAELHGDPSLRMLLIFWGYRVLLQRVPGWEGLQTSLLGISVPLCCLLRQPPARNAPGPLRGGAGVRQAPLQAPVVLLCCQWGLKVEVWGIF